MSPDLRCSCRTRGLRPFLLRLVLFPGMKQLPPGISMAICIFRKVDAAVGKKRKRLQGTVRKIIKPFGPSEPEKAQIAIRGGDDSRQPGWTLQIAVYDRVGGAVSKSQNGKRRMCRRILRNRGCTQDKQVRDLPMLQVRVDHRTVGRAAHD